MDVSVRVHRMKAGKIIRDARTAAGLSQKELGDRVGVSQVAIMKIESGMTEKSKFIPKIAQVLGIQLAQLDQSLTTNIVQPVSKRGSIDGSHPLRVIPNNQTTEGFDLPVYSTAQGGTGALVLSNQPFREIARPQNLVGIKSAYGVLIIGNTMAKEYREGDIAHVDPHLVPRVGDACLFQSEKNGTIEAVIKYLEKPADSSAEVWHVSQASPEKKFTLKKAEWPICHVLVGKQSGR